MHIVGKASMSPAVCFHGSLDLHNAQNVCCRILPAG
jgi:hypothetical protein